MSDAHKALQQITVRQEHVAGARVLHPARRIVQYLTLLILVLIPVTGLFRIDMAAGCATLLDRQVWFSDIFIVLGLWVFVAALLVLMYALVGSVFCGWVCPQNTVSEYANMLTSRLLGRSADMMDLSGNRMQVAARRQSPLNYLLLGIGLLLPAILFALIPLLYLNPPEVIWSFITVADDVPASGSLYWIYFIFVSLFLLDIAGVRHLLCKNFCMYRVWQHAFKKKETLRLAYNEQRSSDCEKCHYCADACFLGLDPTSPEALDSCVNCGECVTACDALHTKSTKLQGPGLLSFTMGSDKAGSGSVLLQFLKGSKGGVLATLFGAAIFFIGMSSYQNNEFSVYQHAEVKGKGVIDYRISIAHKLYRPADISLRVSGLDDSDFTLEKKRVHFDGPGRADVQLHLNSLMDKGLHRFRVIAESDDGWSGEFRVNHYAGNNRAVE